MNCTVILTCLMPGVESTCWSTASAHSSNTVGIVLPWILRHIRGWKWLWSPSGTVQWPTCWIVTRRKSEKPTRITNDVDISFWVACIILLSGISSCFYVNSYKSSSVNYNEHATYFEKRQCNSIFSITVDQIIHMAGIWIQCINDFLRWHRDISIEWLGMLLMWQGWLLGAEDNIESLIDPFSR